MTKSNCSGHSMIYPLMQKLELCHDPLPGDLFELGPQDLIAKDVHVCICDAQYMRNEVAWDEKYTGVRCRSKQHGVWALLVKQFWLGLNRLLTGGMLIFRFGWRDGPPEARCGWVVEGVGNAFTTYRGKPVIEF